MSNLKCLWCKSDMCRASGGAIQCPNTACAMFRKPIAVADNSAEPSWFDLGDLFGQMFGGAR